MHLIILTHGFYSTPSSLKQMYNKLIKLPKTQILWSKVNSGITNTSDGIINAGIRLSHEILEYIPTQKFTKISFVGSSMGGLVNRVAIGLLLNYEEQTIAGLIPTIYISFGTPHLGILDSSYLYQNLGYALTHDSQSLEDFTLRNQTLELISDPKTVYFYGLSLFKTRWLFANIDNDGLVNYESSAITDVYWKLPDNIGDVKGIISDYKDSEYIQPKDNKILQNLQKLEWHRVICETGEYGLISHALVSTGFSLYYKSDIIDTIIYIFENYS